MLPKSFRITALTLGLFAASAASAAPEYIIRYASASPPTSQTSLPIIWFADKLEERSNGRVKVQFFWNGALVKGPDVLESVGAGVVPMGKIYTVSYSGQMPLNQIFNLPFTVEDAHVLQETVDEMHDRFPSMEEEYTRANVKRVGGLATGTVHILSKGPITSLSDMEGMNIRARGVQAEALKAIGAIPVSVPFGELYEALDRGIIEATTMYELSVMPYNFNEPASNLTYAGLGHAMQGEIINLDYWNKLPADVQELLSDTMDDAEAWYAAEFEEKLKRETQQMETGDGTEKVTFHNLPSDELTEWEAMSQQFYQDWANQPGGSEDMLSAFRELLMENKSEVEASGYPDYENN
jgi:TRAP-type C4-dicarboxylate transport system substrate-binding protein